MEFKDAKEIKDAFHPLAICLLLAKNHIFCTSLCRDILDFQIFLLFITEKLEILKEIATAKKELPKFYRTWAFLL